MRISLTFGCGLALGGAIASAPYVMVAGLSGGLVAGGAMPLKWGIESSDSNNLSDAYALKAMIRNLHTT